MKSPIVICEKASSCKVSQTGCMHKKAHYRIRMPIPDSRVCTCYSPCLDHKTVRCVRVKETSKNLKKTPF